MHLLPILNVVGILLIVLGGAQIIPLLTALYYSEAAWEHFMVSGLVICGVGAGFYIFSRNTREISDRDGFAVVTLGWIAAAAAGALP